ncbi:hypothetical protein X777_03584 [Ooceraea biroi]|uniref:Uncharacterized protein n=1 Tax=Ooceraea biroi TaxID=2015173 RepID=A0A026WJH4_OOCBI|nr:hypothetical protein X777_03584 [Ooceraea biroi]
MMLRDDRDDCRQPLNRARFGPDESERGSGHGRRDFNCDGKWRRAHNGEEKRSAPLIRHPASADNSHTTRRLFGTASVC